MDDTGNKLFYKPLTNSDSSSYLCIYSYLCVNIDLVFVN